MTPRLSLNTQSVLLLTAPLIAGRGSSPTDLLSLGEYNCLARHLRSLQRQPADLLGTDSEDLLHACQSVINSARLKRLLDRGFLLSQVVERWQARALWVVSRADPEYPRRLKTRLREDAPAILYGCGNIGLLETGGLAVVGSRHVNEQLIDYTKAVGRLAACAHITVVSGGAQGVDQAAMRGALEGGGNAVGVLAQSLEESAMNRENRHLLIEGRLVLLSRYDPKSGFNVGNAMQRNKVIYALADAALVVNSDLNKGGTWAGAVEQLDKLRLVPIFVRSTGEPSAGLDALVRKGALAWPNPLDLEAFESVLQTPIQVSPTATQLGLSTVATDTVSAVSESDATTSEEALARQPAVPSGVQVSDGTANSSSILQVNAKLVRNDLAGEGHSTPADLLFSAASEAIQDLLKTPMKKTEVAAALEISVAQAKAWLQRLVKQGVLETQTRPLRYVARSQRSLLGNEQPSQRLRRAGTLRR